MAQREGPTPGPEPLHDQNVRRPGKLPDDPVESLAGVAIVRPTFTRTVRFDRDQDAITPPGTVPFHTALTSKPTVVRSSGEAGAALGS